MSNTNASESDGWSADSLDGDVALVTGGSRGIGFAVAQRLLAAGARVAITGRNPSSLHLALSRLDAGDRTLGLAGRSDDPVHRADVMGAIGRQLGPPTILVNNAAVNPVFGPLANIDELAAKKVWDVNVLACLDWTRRFVQAREPSRQARVVNVSSFAALRPSPGIGMYAISKAAVQQLTRDLALEFAPDVRVNTVTPALIKTDFSRTLHAGREDAAAQDYPMQRVGSPTDVAAAIHFLVSPASSWITGTELLVDGGLALTGGVA